MNELKIFALIIFIFSIVVIVFGIYTYIDNSFSTKTKIVDCYDQYNNKIIGQKCISQDNIMNQGVGIIFAGIFLNFISAFAWSTANELENQETI